MGVPRGRARCSGANASICAATSGEQLSSSQCAPSALTTTLERAGDEPLMEGMLVVVTRLSDGVEPVDAVE